jgi:hypothetical protein
MRDTMQAVEEAVFNLLNGQLSYNAVNIPVSDEKKRLNVSANIFVILSTQQEDDGPETSDTFITNSTIDVEVWMKTDYEVSKSPIHNVSNQIYNLVIPAAYGQNGLTAPSGFQFMNVRRLRAITRTVAISETETITGKIITFGITVVEQNP